MDASPLASLDVRSSSGTRRRILGKFTVLAGLIALGAHTFLEDGESVARRRRQRQATDRVKAERKRRKRCKRKPVARICAGKCGPVKSKKTCGRVVDCGACTCQPTSWSNLTTFGSTPAATDALVRPKGVALAADELAVWVADPTLSDVAVWTRPDARSLAWTSQVTFAPSGFFDSPQDVAVSRDGLTAWVSDFHVVSVWTRPHGSSATWSNQTTFGTGGSGDGQFTSPTGLAVSADTRTLWVADAGNSRISVWTRPDATSLIWTNPITFGTHGSGASNLAAPTGVAVTADGLAAFIADRDNHRVSIWTRSTPTSTDWTNQATFGSEGSGSQQLNSPFAVALSRDELTVWVSDAGNSRVSVWTRPSASSITWTNQLTFGSEGISASAFAQPRGLKASADGQTVWLADFGNQRVSVWGRVCPA